MASSLSSAPSITEEDRNKFKVIHVLNTGGQSVLLTVYQHLKPFANSKNIKEHLILDLHIPEHIYKEKFDPTMQNVIETTDNSGEAYDISLLIRCIRVLSSHYEPHNQYKWRNQDELEFKCQKLADKRNLTFHTFCGITIPSMKREIIAIESLLKDILKSLKDRFPSKKSKINDFENETCDKISHILIQPLGESEIKTCLFQKYMKILRDEIPKYKDNCTNKWGKFKILDFMGGSILHDIKLLFTDIMVEKSEKLKSKEKVSYKDISKLASCLSILLISSEAGGGKTTIFCYLINDWGEGGTIMSTTDYDFIFPMLFRDSHTSSVKELISDLLPNVRKGMNTDDIMNCIADPSQKIMFFCDGYDEKNENSLQVFNEICKLKEIYAHIKVIVTSRPESIQEFYDTYKRIHSIEHLMLLGIQESNRGEFLKRYHDELIFAKISKQSSDDLLRFFDSCTRSGRHKKLYRLPINLVILAFLWGTDPDVAKTIKSAAGLYEALVEILNQKLISRILESHKDVMLNLKGNRGKLNRLIDMFKEKVYNESLVATSKVQIYIDNDSVTELDDFCDANGLPFLELKGAFLLSKIEWENSYKLKETLEFPHKGFLDYYSAKCIESKLKDIEKKKEKKDITENSSRGNVIKEIILQTEGEDFKNFPKYQNILQLLGGILALNNSSLVDKYGKHIIDLLETTGIRNKNTQIYDIYNDFNLNNVAAAKFGKLLAPLLDLNDLKIKDSDVQILAILLKYVDIKKVEFDISSTAMPDLLPSLIEVLSEKQCEVSIKEITDCQVEFWNLAISQNKQINTKYINFNIKGTDKPDQLPSLLKVLSDKQCKISIKEIADSQLEWWTDAIKQNDQIEIKDVRLNITRDDMPDKLSVLINILRKKGCQVTGNLSKITDHLVASLNSGNTPFAEINTDKVNITKEHGSLPFLVKIHTKELSDWCQKHLWRELHSAGPNMIRCNMERLCTTVNNIQELPKEMEELRLGLVVDKDTGTSLDPGLAHLAEHCTQLLTLGLHVRAGTKTDHLPCLSDVGRPALYLSQLTNDHLQWAVNTTRKLLPHRLCYKRLVFPQCNMSIVQLCNLMSQMASTGVKVSKYGGIEVSCQLNNTEMQQLEDQVSHTLNCPLYCRQNDEELLGW